MKKKFDLYSELLNKGFTASEDQYGCHCLTLNLEKKVETVWWGEQTRSLGIMAAFNPEHTVVTVYYANGGREDFKVKEHLNEKRALNAIIATAKNQGFEI